MLRPNKAQLKLSLSVRLGRGQSPLRHGVYLVMAALMVRV